MRFGGHVKLKTVNAICLLRLGAKYMGCGSIKHVIEVFYLPNYVVYIPLVITRPMDPTALKNWLVPVSTAISIISVAVGIWLSLRQYRLKVRAETRLTNSAQVESDIKLLQLFTEVMNIAHARGQSIFSDNLMELMLRPEVCSQIAPNGRLDLKDFKDAAVITLPVGSAAQDAAIAAVCELGKKHELLRPVALQALESLSTFKPAIAQPYLEELRVLVANN